MNQALLILGAIILVAGIFGYTYAGEQQGLLQQGEDAVTGEGQNWGLIQSLSLAGIALGAVMVIVGAIPRDWYDDQI